MTGFVLRVAIVALGLWLATQILPGLYFASAGTLLAAALLLGIVNAIVRPIAVVLTLPLTLLSLGLFLLVINALMLMLTSWLSDQLGLGWHVEGFWTAVFGSIIVSVVSWLLNAFLPDRREERR